jgi:hypothetical protein
MTEVLNPKDRGRVGLLRGVVPVVICCGLAVAIYFQSFTVGPMKPQNLLTFARVPAEQRPNQRLPQEWKPRLFSTLLAAESFDLGVRRARAAQPSLFERGRLGTAPRAAGGRDGSILPAGTALALSYAAGTWVSGWFLLTGLLLVAHRGEQSLLYLFGTYSAVSFGYMPGIDERIYAWDMPALFFYTLFVVLHDRNRPWWLLVVLPAAMGFKETAIVLCLSFAFWEGLPCRRRALLLGLSVAACVAVKVAIDLVTANPEIFFTMTTEQWAQPRFLSNLDSVFTLGIPHPLWINAGTLTALLCLPHRPRPAIPMLKLIALVFAGASFVFAYIVEYRIWFELIPIALYGLDLVTLRRRDREPAHP